MKLTLTRASGFELGHRFRELRAAHAHDHQRAPRIENKIKELRAVLDRSAAVLKNHPGCATSFAGNAQKIEARIADLEREAAEIRTASTEKRKETQEIGAELASRRKPAPSFGPHPRPKPCQ